MVMLASSFLRGRHAAEPDRSARGRDDRRSAVQRRPLPRQLHAVADDAVSDVGRDGGHRPRLRLPRADHRRLEVVSESPRSRERPRDRHLRRRLRHLRPDRRQAGRRRRLAYDLADLRRDVLRLHHGRRVPDEGSAGGLQPPVERFDRGQPAEGAPHRGARRRRCCGRRCSTRSGSPTRSARPPARW